MTHAASILVIPLGPGDPDLLTLKAAEALQGGAGALIFRTGKHPVASWLQARGIIFESLDAYYERFDDFDQMHASMARELWDRAKQVHVRFAVMDPETDGAVRELKKKCPPGSKLEVLPGVSLRETLLSSLPTETDNSDSLQYYSASSFLSLSWHPDIPLLITELDSPLLAGDVALKLSELYSDSQEVFFFPPDRKSRRKALSIPLFQLASQKAYDHTAAVWVPGLDFLHRDRFTMEDLSKIVSRLRAPDGCPWDRIQTHNSLRPYMVEEAWEAVNAIDAEDSDHLADELGDVLFQVFIHASIGESFDEFTLTDVVSLICQKMIRRHPHVFGTVRQDSAQSVSDGWEKLKREETGSKTAGESLEDVSQSLPSLKYSIKVYKKLAQLPALRRAPKEIAEEIRALSEDLIRGESFSPEAMSCLLLKCTELCYREDQDAEILLHQGVEKLKHRYRKAEEQILHEGRNPEALTIQELMSYIKE